MSETTTRPTEPAFLDPAHGDTAVLGADEARAHAESQTAPADGQRRGFSWSRDLRFMAVVLAAIVVLFIAFALVLAFAPDAAGVSALAIVAAPVATMVAVYYGVSVTLRQLHDARRAADAAEARARAAEAAARDSDAWAAQMESGLRLAVSKLTSARIETRDVERAAGTPDDFF